LANDTRNHILEQSRKRSSAIGRARAERLKPEGLNLEYLIERYAGRLFKKAPAQLAEAERNAVFLEIVESSGRANPKGTAGAVRLRALGKAFWVFTAAVAVYNVATAENTGEALAKEGVGIGGGMLGGAAGGAAAGLVCGPGAPVCVTIGVFVGGALGALGAD